MTDETQLAKVEFRVEYAEGEVDVETLWATPLDNDLYRLENSPFFAYDVSWEDVVEALREAPEGFQVFQRVVERSGNRSLVTVNIPRDADLWKLREFLIE